ncbi:hypothetical protein SpCBS45565_g01700 [Spizellomyces sp. 'palustris']|nr:hypothetical protein SpCBS45565_g01700 [Spizellomyces sp. 'palustris']
MAGLPRDLIKWIQSLSLSASIKNYKRDFANGFLIAEILNKYYPHEPSLQMHAYDTGTGPAAKKNNWEMLGRAFAKLGITVPRGMSEDVSQAKPDSVGLLLMVLYSHVSKKKEANSVLPTLKASNSYGVEADEVFQPSQVDGSGFAMIDASPGQILTGGTHVKEGLEDHENLGKGAIVRVLLKALSIHDPSITFNRSGFSATQIRDRLCEHIESMSSNEVHRIEIILMGKEREIVEILQHSPPNDISMLLDILITCIASYDAVDKVFVAASCTLQFFGLALQHAFSSRGAAYQHLCSAKEFPSLVHQLSNPHTISKIPHIVAIFHQYMGTNLRDEERVRFWLEIKAAMSRDTLPTSTITIGGIPSTNQSVPSTCNPFIFILAALSFLPNLRELHGPNRQLTTLHLSECLTVINTHRRSLQAPILNPTMPAELPAAVLILAFLVREIGVVLDDPLLGNVMECIGKAVMGRRCSSAVQKAFVAFVAAGAQAAANRGDDVDTGLGKETMVKAAAGVLKWFMGDSLRVALILLAPLLRSYPTLCTSFVRGLLSLSDSERVRLLDLDSSRSGENSATTHISWDLPFLLLQRTEGVCQTWWPLGVSMGVAKLVKNSHAPLPLAYIHMLQAITKPTNPHEESVDHWSTLMEYVGNPLVASLAENTTTEAACILLNNFRILCPGGPVKYLPAMMATLIHAYLTGRGRCQNAIVQLLTHWAAKKSPHPNSVASVSEKLISDTRRILNIVEKELFNGQKLDVSAIVPLPV